MKHVAPLGLRALRLTHKASVPAQWQRLRAMSTVVDYAGRPSQPPPAPAGMHENVERQRAERAKRIMRDAVTATQLRHNWTKEEIAAIYYQPMLELTYQSVSSRQPFPLPCYPLPQHHGNWGHCGFIVVGV